MRAWIEARELQPAGAEVRVTLAARVELVPFPSMAHFRFFPKRRIYGFGVSAVSKSTNIL